MRNKIKYIAIFYILLVACGNKDYVVELQNGYKLWRMNSDNQLYREMYRRR